MSLVSSGKAKEQTWSSLDDKEIEDDGDVVTSLDEDKRAAHIFRYGRAPVFRYGKRAPSVFRYGKKATVFRYGKRSPAVDDLALVVPVDEATLDRLAASDYLPVAEEHKRKIFRYGKRSA